MEYRGYDSAGIAVVEGGELHVAKKAGKIANLDAELAARPLPVDGLGIGHTRWATHGGPTDVNAHPHVSADGRVAVVHNGIIENFAALRAELAEDGDHLRLRDRHRGRRRTCSASRSRPGSAWTRPCGRSAAGCTGAFTLVAVDAQGPRSVVAARRNSPLVVGVGEGEHFLASDVAAFIEHTRDAIELGQDQVVVITDTTRRGHRLRRRAGAGPALPRRLGPVGRGEGRLRLVHAQGDLRAAQGGRRHPARPARRRRPADPRRDPDLRGRAAPRRQDRDHRLRHRLLRRDGRQVRDRALDPHPLRGRAGQRVPLPRPDRRPDHAGRGDQPVRARPPTR